MKKTLCLLLAVVGLMSSMMWATTVIIGQVHFIHLVLISHGV